eukprot:2281811-Amphidinium_carterae.1
MNASQLAETLPAKTRRMRRCIGNLRLVALTAWSLRFVVQSMKKYGDHQTAKCLGVVDARPLARLLVAHTAPLL